MNHATAHDYFDRLYAENADPWRIRRGWYEERKRALVMAAMPRPRYRLALEPACGNGDLTELLATRCDRVIAWDGAARAVTACRNLTRGSHNVEVRLGQLPGQWPCEQADLVVLSEIGYYLSAQDLDEVVSHAAAGLTPGGTLLAVHWRRPVPDFALNGDDVHAHVFGRLALTRLGGYTDEDIRMDVFIRTDGQAPSVAEESGVV
jgi:SAM-dependent methyltransferase